MAAPYGLDEPNHGSAPYAEAANQGRARMSTLQRIAMALAGAGQGIQSLRPGVGPLGSALTGFSRGFIMSNAAERAAQDYAMKQQEAEEERASRKIRDRMNEALAKRYETEKAPEPRKVPTNILEMTPEEFALYKTRSSELKPPKENTGTPTNIADMTPEQFAKYKARKAELDAVTSPTPERLPPQFIQEQVRLINSMDPRNPKHLALLKEIVRNPPTPEEGKAAEAKLTISPGYFRR